MVKSNDEKKSTTSSETFIGFVLLSKATWDKAKLLADLKKEWNLELSDDGKNDDSIVVNYKDELIAVSLMPAPIPNQEAEENAANNYMWPEAVEITKQHQAHLIVVVKGPDTKILELGKEFVKVIASCCQQPNTLGVFTSGTVFEPKFYYDFAQMVKDDELPIYNWIWFGLYQGENGICCYTYGMDAFHKDEMEVLDGGDDPEEVQEFLSNIALYVLGQDITLKDGETIGFSENDKHSIIRSKGVSLPGDTLKISFK